MAEVVGAIPGRLTHVFYQRTGAFPGSTEHPVRERVTRVRMLAQSDGTILLKPTRRGVRLWSAVEVPGMGCEYQFDETRRQNPMLAEFLNPRHGRHGGAGALAISGVVSHPMKAVWSIGRAALFSTGGAFGVVYAGDMLIAKVLPATYQSTVDPTTGGVAWGPLLAHSGVRLAVGVGADLVLHRMLSGHDFLALNVGLGLGILGSLALEALGATLVLGKGEAASLPGATTAPLVGTGAYIRRVAGTGAYIRRLGVGDVGARYTRFPTMYRRAGIGQDSEAIGDVGDYWPTTMNSITRSSFDRS